MKKMTHDRVREMLDYDPLTGIFRWRKKPNANIVVGSVAGTPDAYGYLQSSLDGRGSSCTAWLGSTPTGYGLKAR
jgi:hypothetical protein